MKLERELLIKVWLPDADGFSTTDFYNLFDLADSVCRSVLREEALLLVSALPIPEDLRREAAGELTTERRVPIHADVKDIRAGSWTIEILIPAAAVFYFLDKFVTPSLQEAWKDSDLQKSIVAFLKTKVFAASRARFEEPEPRPRRKFRTVRVESARVLAETTETSTRVQIEVSRAEHLEEPTDGELLAEFAKKLKQ